MDAENIKDVLKNIKLTGELNSETLEKVSKDIAPKVMPFVWFREVMSRVESILWAVTTIVISSILVKGCAPFWSKMS